MSIVFLAKGICKLGMTRRDADGKIKEQQDAVFEASPDGGSVAVGLLDVKTMEPEEDAVEIFGDWDAAGYLTAALERLRPHRKINIPDMKAIIQKAYTEDGNALLCDYCQDLNCMYCIVKEWRDEVE